MAKILAAVLMLSSAASSPAFAVAALEGRVVGVKDGDTIVVLVNSEQVVVRLGEIDTPEKKQPFGAKAKQVLSGLVFNKTVRVVEQARDRYGRLVGRVYVGDVDVSAEMVSLGVAWVYRAYSKDRRLLELEAEARQEGRGLWRLPEAQRQAPWEWRKAQKGRARPVLRCGSKTKCSEMVSCEEAMFYLRRCGLGGLDRDGDGVACEGVCR